MAKPQGTTTQIFEAATPAALLLLVNPVLQQTPPDQIVIIFYSSISTGATRREMCFLTTKIYNQ